MQESDAECRITAQKVTGSSAGQRTLCGGETEHIFCLLFIYVQVCMLAASKFIRTES